MLEEIRDDGVLILDRVTTVGGKSDCHVISSFILEIQMFMKRPGRELKVIKEIYVSMGNPTWSK